MTGDTRLKKYRKIITRNITRNSFMNDLYSVLQNSRFGKVLVMVLFALALYLAVLTINAVKAYQYIGADIAPMNTITVSGEGEVFAVPDTAEFSFSVNAEGAAAEEAQTKSAQKMNEILAYLREEGVLEEDIKTTGYNLFPRYEYRQTETCIDFRCPPGERELIGFEVTQRVQVKLEGTSEAGALIAGAGARGATDVSGLNFTVDDEDALLADARARAITDAKEKARVLARDLGVRLGRVVSFNEGGSPNFYRMDAVAERAFGMGGDAMVAPELPVGENKIASQVTITYEIR